MPQSRNVSPLLKPTHFNGLCTRFTEKGLRFSIRIDSEHRQAEICDFVGGVAAVEDLLEKLKNLRPFTNVTVNPRRPSAQSLLKIFREAQETLLPGEAISLGYGLDKKYMLRWERQRKSVSDDMEGQAFILVAFNGAHPAGFAGLRITLIHDAESKRIYISQSVSLVYVHPALRGQGFGIDLSIACGYLCQDVLVATYRAVPAGYTIVPAINADLESEGGERFILQVADAMNFQVDMLRIDGKRKSIVVEHAEVDAGY